MRTDDSPAQAPVEALDMLYRRSYHEYLRVADAIVGEMELAHDAVQDAFARAIRGRFENRETGSLEGWVWRTVVNAARNARRDAPPARRSTAARKSRTTASSSSRPTTSLASARMAMSHQMMQRDTPEGPRPPSAQFIPPCGQVPATYNATVAVRAQSLPVAPWVRIELRSSRCAAFWNAGFL